MAGFFHDAGDEHCSPIIRHTTTVSQKVPVEETSVLADRVAGLSSSSHDRSGSMPDSLERKGHRRYRSGPRSSFRNR